MTTTLSNYASDVATVLGAAGIGLTLGTNLYTGPMRAHEAEGVPNEAVFVITVGGRSPIDYCDHSHTPQLHFPRVQIMVRSDPHDWDGGLALANDIYEAIHSKEPSGYVSARSAESAPIHVGETDNGEFLWSINVDLIKEET